MMPSIRTQTLTPPYQSIADPNKKEAVSKSNVSRSFSESLGKKRQVSRPDHLEISELTRADIQSIIQNKILELKNKLENGETEPTYQIGSRALTKKEWDNLIYKVDSALEKDENKAENESEEKKEEAIKAKDREQKI